MRGVINLQILIKFWIGWRITPVSYWMYLGWVVLARLTCIQPSHLCHSLARLRLRFLLESWKGISCQVLIRCSEIKLTGALLANFQCVCFQYNESVAQINFRSISSTEPADLKNFLSLHLFCPQSITHEIWSLEQTPQHSGVTRRWTTSTIPTYAYC
jgi:hypothetical protein